MPFALHRGQRIHYEVAGQGPAVILQHGLFSRAAAWGQYGYVEGLRDAYRVITVDSLGHGESDKPGDVSLYGGRERAGDVMAVLDAVGSERAHFVGYSMGAWMGTHLAIHHPSRIASLTLGGWDPVGGLTFARGQRPTFEQVLAAAKVRMPALVAWITPETTPAVFSCWTALGETEAGAREALARLEAPVLLWAGTGDACHAGVKSLAEACQFDLLSVEGDHVGAMIADPPRVMARLRHLFAA